MSNINILFEKIRNYYYQLDDLIEIPLVEVDPPKSSGVYLVFFYEKLQYAGSTTNLSRRLKNDLMNGSTSSHTLISKLCKISGSIFWIITGFLKSNAMIRYIETDNVNEAKILEEFIIALKDPPYNGAIQKIMPNKELRVRENRA
ncbi:MAG: GIY-YIG nuclease family protein [Candidatus Bathyarchaeota archaeon]|nr:GIY-YIG nuclease family protein [Candidatus Bathyarchaeota archaeon]